MITIQIQDHSQNEALKTLRKDYDKREKAINTLEDLSETLKPEIINLMTSVNILKRNFKEESEKFYQYHEKLHEMLKANVNYLQKFKMDIEYYRQEVLAKITEMSSRQSDSTSSSRNVKKKEDITDNSQQHGIVTINDEQKSLENPVNPVVVGDLSPTTKNQVPVGQSHEKHVIAEKAPSMDPRLVNHHRSSNNIDSALRHQHNKRREPSLPPRRPPEILSKSSSTSSLSSVIGSQMKCLRQGEPRDFSSNPVLLLESVLQPNARREVEAAPKVSCDVPCYSVGASAENRALADAFFGVIPKEKNDKCPYQKSVHITMENVAVGAAFDITMSTRMDSDVTAGYYSFIGWLFFKPLVPKTAKKNSQVRLYQIVMPIQVGIKLFWIYKIMGSV